MKKTRWTLAQKVSLSLSYFENNLTTRPIAIISTVFFHGVSAYCSRIMAAHVRVAALIVTSPPSLLRVS